MDKKASKSSKKFSTLKYICRQHSTWSHPLNSRSFLAPCLYLPKAPIYQHCPPHLF
jgi:hypothetical protein